MVPEALMLAEEAPSTRPLRETTLQGGRAPRSPASDGSRFGARKGPPPRILERNAIEQAKLNLIRISAVTRDMLRQAPSTPTRPHDMLKATNRATPTQVKPHFGNSVPPQKRSTPLPPTLNQPRIKRFHRTARCLRPGQGTLGTKASQSPGEPGRGHETHCPAARIEATKKQAREEPSRGHPQEPRGSGSAPRLPSLGSRGYCRLPSCVCNSRRPSSWGPRPAANTWVFEPASLS